MQRRQHYDGVAVAPAAFGQELDLISGWGEILALTLKGGAGEGARTTIKTISSVK